MNAISHREAAPAIRPQNFGELDRFAQMAAKSTFVPKDYRDRPDNIMVAVQMGSEVGLAPMQSLQNISVINGRPSIWGDAMLALCLSKPVCEDVVETPTLDNDGNIIAFTCVAKRRGKQAKAATFSIEDAKRARLWGKEGTWTQYPQRMLQMRARGFALRDQFPDVLRGLISAEEAGDMPTGPTIDGAVEPAPQAKAKREPAPPKPELTRETEAESDAGGNGDDATPESQLWLGIHKQRLESGLADEDWLIAYEDACATASSEADLVRLHGIGIIDRALVKAPEAVKHRMTRASSAAFKRLTKTHDELRAATIAELEQEPAP